MDIIENRIISKGLKYLAKIYPIVVSSAGTNNPIKEKSMRNKFLFAHNVDLKRNIQDR